MQSKYPVDVLFIACLLVTEMRKPVQLGTACGMATDRHKIDRNILFLKYLILRCPLIVMEMDRNVFQ